MSALEDLGLPGAAKEKLAAHGNGNLLEALDHPLRRIIDREIQFGGVPKCVKDLEQAESPLLRTVNRRDLEFHVGILDDLGVLKPVAERVVATGVQPIYLSTAPADRVVKEVLAETADFDLCWDGSG